MLFYKKLRNGSWGVRGDGEVPAAGDLVLVTKRSGDTKEETVSRVLWSGPEAWIATIKRGARKAPRVRTFDEYERFEGIANEQSEARYFEQDFGEN